MRIDSKAAPLASLFGLGLLPVMAQAGQVRYRERVQQHRIVQGGASGQITAAGAATLENRERTLNQTRVADRNGNGGALTPGQRARLGQQANGVSHQICTDKHNQPTQTGVSAQ
jgi:hypothetical protein